MRASSPLLNHLCQILVFDPRQLCNSGRGSFPLRQFQEELIFQSQILTEIVMKDEMSTISVRPFLKAN